MQVAIILGFGEPIAARIRNSSKFGMHLFDNDLTIPLGRVSGLSCEALSESPEAGAIFGGCGAETFSKGPVQGIQAAEP